MHLGFVFYVSHAVHKGTALHILDKNRLKEKYSKLNR